MERSLLYVSRQSPFTAAPQRSIQEIVDQARRLNEMNGITGALVATRDHFAQLIEGPRTTLLDLMGQIERDQRHTEVTVLRVEAISERRLPEWSMAYSGISSYVARQVMPLVDGTIELRDARIERLMSLLVGLASPSRVPTQRQ